MKIRYADNFKIKYPEKTEAHRVIQRLRRKGELKPEPCEVCQSAQNIHAHHDDYTKPLEIRWLCRSHHIEWHKSNKPIYKESKEIRQRAKQREIANGKYCSFCGKHKTEVFILITGLKVQICDECVDCCAGIIEKKKKENEELA